jgi:hypothetical protein
MKRKKIDIVKKLQTNNYYEVPNKQLLWSSTQTIGISFNFQEDKTNIFFRTFNNSKKIIISA